jgi:allantoinase
MFSVPPTTSLKNLKTKISQAKKSRLHVDCAFWGGVTNDNHDELLAMDDYGCCGFKGFLNPQDSYPEFSHLTHEGLKKALEILEETNCVFAVR